MYSIVRMPIKHNTAQHNTKHSTYKRQIQIQIQIEILVDTNARTVTVDSENNVEYVGIKYHSDLYALLQREERQMEREREKK